MNEGSNSKYELYLSTDGKCTLKVNADNSTEVLNALQSENVRSIWQQIKNMAGELKFQQTKVAAVANGGSAGDCPIHHVPLEWGKSKSTGKSYKFHREGTEMCFGHA